MIDYQRTVDDIQSVLYSGGMLPVDALARLSTAYARACEEANDRLRECQGLMRKGLRAEAIQRSEVEPNLPELVSTLDFPERAQWCALVQDTKLLMPPELLINVAADLNSEYAREQPLTPLMRRHRLLALSRAPLPLRIATLRQINGADPGNPVWQEDLKIYERVRHDQIQAALAVAGRDRDLDTLASLEQELQDPSWLEPPHPTLVRTVGQTRLKVRKSRAKDQLVALVPELTAAYGNFDYEKGRPLRDRWNDAIDVVGLPPDDPLCEAAAPALEWVEREDQEAASRQAYTDTLAELEAALDRDAPQVELERVYHALAQFDQEIPEGLVHRYHSRLDALAVAAGRRAKLIMTSTLAALVFAAAGTTALVAWHFRSQETANHAAALEQLLSERKLTEADQYWTNLEAKYPSVTERPQLQDLKVRLDGLMQAETNRRSAFADAIAAANAAGVKQPDQRAIDEARRLASNEAERAELRKVEGKISQWLREEQRQRDDRFMARIDELMDPVAKLEKGELLGFPARMSAVEDLLGRAAKIEREGTEVSPEVRANLEPLKIKLQGWKTSELEQQRMASHLQTITAAVGDHVAFRDELSKYAAAFPGTSRAEEFNGIAAKEFAVWESFAIWSPLVDRWSQGSATLLTSTEAQQRIDAAKALLSTHKLFADSAAAEQLLPFLESIARRDGPGGKLVAGLNQPLNHFLVANLHMVRTKDGKRYYCKEKPQEIPGIGIEVRYLADTNENSTPKRRRILQDQIQYVGEALQSEAPQSEVSRKARAALRNLTDDKWEATFFEIVRDILRQEQMDPIVKAQLLQTVLDVACKGSHCLEKAFSGQLAALNGAATPDVNWIDPNGSQANQARTEAAGLIDSLRCGEDNLKMIARQIGGDREKLAGSPFTHRYPWVGWLLRDADGKWKCMLSPESKTIVTDLFVARLMEPAAAAKDGASASIAMTAIGKVERSAVALSPNATKYFNEGRPVYAKVPIEAPRRVALPDPVRR